MTGQVDAEAQAGVFRDKRGEGADRMHNDPAIDLRGQPEALGTGQKTIRHDELTALVAQAQQHFVCGRLLAARVHDRLGNQYKLVVFDGVLDAPRPAHVQGHGRHVGFVLHLEHVHAVAAGTLGQVTGEIGVRQHLLRGT